MYLGEPPDREDCSSQVSPESNQTLVDSQRPVITMLTLKEKSKFTIVPSPMRRQWIDRFPLKAPYKCLPMNIASQYGWAILNPVRFSASWDGGNSSQAIQIAGIPDYVNTKLGGGIITFEFDFCFRTSPGWNLWLRGLPNYFIDGAHPLEEIVETDGLPFTATMNWHLTRKGETLEFKKDAPICFITPVARGQIERFQTLREELSTHSTLAEKYQRYKSSRMQFLEEERSLRRSPTEWQKHYMRGMLDGEKLNQNPPQSSIVLESFDKPAEPNNNNSKN